MLRDQDTLVQEISDEEKHIGTKFNVTLEKRKRATYLKSSELAKSEFAFSQYIKENGTSFHVNNKCGLSNGTYNSEVYQNAQNKHEMFEEEPGEIENADGVKFTSEKRLNGFQKIGVTSKYDKLPCDITGSCFDENEYLVIADNANKSIKSIDVPNRFLLSVVLLKDAPWDLAYIEEECQVATTLPSTGKIQFLSISEAGDLIKEQDISAGKQCRGIVYSRGCFIVSYGHSRSKNGGKIQIIHTNGVLLHTFSRDRAGNQLFHYASHIALSKDQNTIYVTDFAKRSIVSLQFDGTVNAVSTDDIIKDPRGLAVGADEKLYVCDFFSNCVYMLSTDLQESKIEADIRDGVISPRSIAFNKGNDTMIVTMFYKRFIAVFSVAPDTSITD